MAGDDSAMASDAGVPRTMGPSDNEKATLVLSELLCYVQYHMKRTTHINISEIVANHFSFEEISQARDILIANYEDEVGHLLKNRRNTPNKIKCVTMSEDIMNSLQELDMKGINTNFVAKNLSRLPKCDPKDIDPYATMQLLLAIDDRLKKVEDNMGEAMAKVIFQGDGLKTIKDAVKTHELLLTNRMLPSDPTYQNMVSSLGNNQSGLETANKSPKNAESRTRNKDNSDQQSVENNESQERENNGGYDIPGPESSNQLPTNDENRAMKNTDIGDQLLVARNKLHERESDYETRREECDTENRDNPWITVGKNGRPVQPRDNRQDRRQIRSTGGQQVQRGQVSSELHSKQGKETPGMKWGRPQHQVKRQRYRVHGSNQSEMLEGAPPPGRDFFLSRVKNTDDEAVKNYIESKGITVRELIRVSNVNAKYKSFKLSVCKDNKDKVMSPELWPQGVCIEKWRSRANNQETVFNQDNGRA